MGEYKTEKAVLVDAAGYYDEEYVNENRDLILTQARMVDDLPLVG